MKKPASQPPAPPSKASPKPTPPATHAPRTLLVLLRHGDAGDALALPERDALRPLTSKGRKQARRAGKALARMGLVPRDVWTSRLVRASETAREALDAARSAARSMPTATLAPEASPERIVRALADTPPPPAPVGTKASKRTAVTPRPVGRGSRGPIESPPAVRWLVGHDPHLVRLVALSTGAPAAAIRLPKGAFAVVAFDGRGPAAGTGTLMELIDPDALKAVSKHGKS
jgi:phosphohistidine phosphatase SixA